MLRAGMTTTILIITNMRKWLGSTTSPADTAITNNNGSAGDDLCAASARQGGLLRDQSEAAQPTELEPSATGGG